MARHHARHVLELEQGMTLLWDEGTGQVVMISRGGLQAVTLSPRELCTLARREQARRRAGGVEVETWDGVE